MINTHVLMSGADFFSDEFAINPYMDSRIPINIEKAKAEHASIAEALQSAGVKITVVSPPTGCQDGVYTANWALCRDDIAVMSRLPNKRQAEQPYAKKVLQQLGKKIIEVPENLKFSGQGDALPCGEYLFMGSAYRTDAAAHNFVATSLGYKPIGLQTVPKRRLFGWGSRVTNPTTGWPDSFFYDIDLALAVINPTLIAWCPKAFMPASQNILKNLPIEKIEVNYKEATQGFACNLVSTGETVVMSAKAPKLKAQLEKRGIKTITPEISELAKGGGYIRCTTLTLN